jgi:hypothetical protein
MTTLLDQAIEKIRALPEPEQDEAAEFLLLFLSKYLEPLHLDDETRAAIQKGLEQADRGEFASDAEMAELFKRHGV